VIYSGIGAALRLDIVVRAILGWVVVCGGALYHIFRLGLAPPSFRFGFRALSFSLRFWALSLSLRFWTLPFSPGSRAALLRLHANFPGFHHSGRRQDHSR
jgi:hypothetical protein